MRKPFLLASALLAGCASNVIGTDSGADVRDGLARLDGGNNAIALSPPQGFEGQRRYAGSVGPGRGDDDLSAATISTTPESGIVIETSVCTRLSCAFVAHIDDRVANRGAPIPDVVSATGYPISIVGALYNYTATLRVLPLDSADSAAIGATTVASNAVYSSMSILAGTQLRSSNLESPVRLAILGAVEMHGELQLSAINDERGAGGYAGGAVPMEDGQGPAPGVGSSLAGGGGGNAMAGGMGRGAGGEAAGAGGAESMDPAVRRLEGGSGGGAGGGGTGGGGGGALLLAVYGPSNFESGRILAGGGNGAGAGGGGAGGTVLLAGSPTGSFVVDLTGGNGGTAGGARGGNGSQGRLRLDGQPTAADIQGATVVSGVRFDIAAIPAITRTPELTIRGFARPGTRVVVQNETGGSVVGMMSTMTDAMGQWSLVYTMMPGAAVFVAYDASQNPPVPSYSGTRVVLRSRTGVTEMVSGAIDVVYLPM